MQIKKNVNMVRRINKLRRVSCAFDAEKYEVTPYQSLGQKIRDAIDQGVQPDVNPGTMEFDTEDDGDMVDPLNDPRTDSFEVAQAYQCHLSDLADAESKKVE